MINKTIKDDISKELSLLEEYDKTFDLFDHSQEDDLISIVYMHPDEDPLTGSKGIAMINEIIGLRVPELTGESLGDLMAYPRHVLEHLMKVASKHRTKEAELFKTPPPPT